MADIPRELLEKLFDTMKKERPNIPVTEICIMNIPCNRYFIFNKGMEATGLEIYSFLDSIEFLPQSDWYNIFWYAIYKGKIRHEAFIGYNIIRRDDCELKKIDRWRTLGTYFQDNMKFNTVYLPNVFDPSFQNTILSVIISTTNKSVYRLPKLDLVEFLKILSEIYKRLSNAS